MSDLLDYQRNTKGNTTQNIAKCISLLPVPSSTVQPSQLQLWVTQGTNLSLFLVIMRGKYFYDHLHNGISTMKNLPNGVPRLCCVTCPLLLEAIISAFLLSISFPWYIRHRYNELWSVGKGLLEGIYVRDRHTRIVHCMYIHVYYYWQTSVGIK